MHIQDGLVCACRQVTIILVQCLCLCVAHQSSVPTHPLVPHSPTCSPLTSPLFPTHLPLSPHSSPLVPHSPPSQSPLIPPCSPLTPLFPTHLPLVPHSPPSQSPSPPSVPTHLPLVLSLIHFSKSSFPE